MTAEPLTAAEASVVARFDAAPPAEESFIERLRDAMYTELDSLGLTDQVSSHAAEFLADAALTVMRPAPDTAKTAEGAAL